MNRYQVNIWVRGRTDRTVVYESNGHGDAYNLELVTKNGSTRERFTNSSSIYGSGILNQLKKLPRGATIDVSVSSAKDLENVLRSLYTGKVHRVSPDEKDIGGAGVAAAGGGATISAVGPVNELGVREEHEHVEPGTGTCKTPFQYGMDK